MILLIFYEIRQRKRNDSWFGKQSRKRHLVYCRKRAYSSWRRYFVNRYSANAGRCRQRKFFSWRDSSWCFGFCTICRKNVVVIDRVLHILADEEEPNIVLVKSINVIPNNGSSSLLISQIIIYLFAILSHLLLKTGKS